MSRKFTSAKATSVYTLSLRDPLGSMHRNLDRYDEAASVWLRCFECDSLPEALVVWRNRRVGADKSSVNDHRAFSLTGFPPCVQCMLFSGREHVRVKKALESVLRYNWGKEWKRFALLGQPDSHVWEWWAFHKQDIAHPSFGGYLSFPGKINCTLDTYSLHCQSLDRSVSQRT